MCSGVGFDLKTFFDVILFFHKSEDLCWKHKMNLFENGKSAFSQVSFNSRVNTPWPSTMSFYTVPLWNLFRFALVCACILFAVLMSMVYSLNQAGTTLTKNGLILRDSPLRLLLIKDQNMAEDLQYWHWTFPLIFTLSSWDLLQFAPLTFLSSLFRF